MSEKLEETFELPVDQELLDTSILESMRQPTFATENDEQPAEKPQLTREKQQATGQRIMDAARYLPSGPVKEVLALDLGEVQEEVAPTHYDIVIERATQALGPAQFEGLVNDLKQSAHEDAPDVTMEKFRTQAGSLMMDAGELWEAILVKTKQERFGDKKLRQGVKFYYSMPFDEFKQVLQTQKLERTDGQANALASNLKLTADRLRDGKWESGFDAAQDCKPADVTFVFGGEIVDQDDFIALGEQPTINSVSLKDKCLGVVFADTNGHLEDAIQALTDSELYMLPAFLAETKDGENWSQTYYDADYLRDYKQTYAERTVRKEQLRREIFVDVDHFEIAREVRKYSQRISTERMIDLIDQCQNLETEEDRERADIKILQMLNEVLDLGQTPEVKTFNDPAVGVTGLCEHRPRERASIISVNRAKIDGSNLRESLANLSHEAWHDHQDGLADCLDDVESRKTLSSSELHRAELYRLNHQTLILPEDDIIGYTDQLIEVEARRFEAHVLKIFDRALKEQQRPSHKLKRSVAGLRNSISLNGKRVAKKSDIKNAKVTKKPRGGKRVANNQDGESMTEQEILTNNPDSESQT